MKKRTLFILTIVSLIIFIVYTILVKTIDVAAIGPENSSVGFSTINGFFRDLIGYNETWYDISKYLGIIPFFIVANFALIGCRQLYDRRSLLKVDIKILLLGGFYAVVGILYILFDKFPINYRPFLQDGVLEPSYPSSHTMLALCISLTAIYLARHYIKNKSLLKIFVPATFFLMLAIVISRMLSGVHWITDIIGGITISITLVLIYLLLVKYFGHDQKRI